MAVYQVKGCLRESGEEVDYEIDANSEAHARQLANADGVMVERVASVSIAMPSAPPMPHYQHPPQQPKIVVAPQTFVSVAQYAGPSAVGGGCLPALLSLIIPGLGQVANGQPVNGIVWFVAVAIGYVCFVIPGVVLHILCIVGASQTRRV